MAFLYLSLGSNLGDKRKNIEQAITLLSERVGGMLALSKLYETEPWGYQSDKKYLNAAALFETYLSPEKILLVTESIETACGRLQKTIGNNYHDRTIDIDVLLYNNLILQTPRLTIPHPLMHLRPYVLKPLSEIAPDAIHPVIGKSIIELCDL